MSLFAVKAENNKIHWEDEDRNHVKTTTNYKEVQNLSKEHMLCINGDVLD